MKFREQNYIDIHPVSSFAELPVIVEENGQRIKVIRLVEQDKEPYKDYTSQDFDLMTLIETGNINNIQTVHSLPGEALDAIDAAVDTYNTIVNNL